MAGMMEARSWTQQEIRELIQIEVSIGLTMVILKSAITSGELSTNVGQVAATAHAALADTIRAFQMTTGQITVQEREINKASDEIARILGDCRTFVEQTQTQAVTSRTEMIQRVEALHAKQQDIVKFVDGVPETVAALQEKLRTISDWCADNNLDAVPVTVGIIQERLDTLTDQVDAVVKAARRAGPPALPPLPPSFASTCC